MRQIKESDWKHFSRLAPIAVERFCQRVLDDLVSIASDRGKSQHQRYISIYRLIRNRDKELAGAFDDRSRSKALFQLADWYRLKLLSDEEFSRFSDETRSIVGFLLGRGESSE